MKQFKLLYVACFFMILSGCSALNVYKNAYEPVDRVGKENWAYMKVQGGNTGHILISPRPKGNMFSQIESTGVYNARAEILLEQGLRDINVHVYNGAKGALFTIEDINIEENGEYLVKYEIKDDQVKAWVVDTKTGKDITEKSE